MCLCVCVCVCVCVCACVCVCVCVEETHGWHSSRHAPPCIEKGCKRLPLLQDHILGGTGGK